MAGSSSNRRLAFALLMVGCAARGPSTHQQYVVQPLQSGTTISMRGVSVVNARVAWVSGTRGTVLRTHDGGATWAVHAVPGADSLDFRDIEAIDEKTAYVLSAGEDGRIYKTMDSGVTWTLQFRNRTTGAFFDCIDFWDATHGLALSDPVAGNFLILHTTDGRTWQTSSAAKVPTVLDGEAAFAASGTCLVTAGPSRAYLATGGAARTRVFVTHDRGRNWTATATPVPAGAPAAGIFSLAFSDEMRGIAVGGNYEKFTEESVVAMTQDGGRSWNAVGKTPYVSGAAFVQKSDIVVAVGTTGTRVSYNAGATWVTIDTVAYNAVQFAADGTGYAVGPRGRIARLTSSRAAR